MSLPFCGASKLFVMATYIFVWGATLRCPVHSELALFALRLEKKIKPSLSTNFLHPFIYD